MEPVGAGAGGGSDPGLINGFVDRLQYTAIRLLNRSAVRSCASSALQPDFITLKNVSMFQRIAYQSSFSMACSRD